MEKEDIISLAKSLYQEAFESNCYYSMLEQYQSALKSYGDTIEYFPAFYNLTYNALMASCFMDIAKLFDNSKGATRL